VTWVQRGGHARREGTQMAEAAMNTATQERASGTAEGDDLLQRVREAVARTREVIRSSQEMLAHDAAPADDEAAN
jgi:hypothetical protein